MRHFASHDLTKKQQYKFLSGAIIPRPIAWITTQNQDGLVNAAPFSFFSGASNELPLATLAILRKNGVLKDSARNILEQQELVIHFVNETVVADMNQTAANLAPEESEVVVNKLATISSQTVAVPGLTAAPIRMEAVLHQYLPIKDGERVLTDLFVVRITDFYFDESLFDAEREYILPESFAPIARLAGNHYANIGDFFELERPQ